MFLLSPVDRKKMGDRSTVEKSSMVERSSSGANPFRITPIQSTLDTFPGKPQYLLLQNSFLPKPFSHTSLCFWEIATSNPDESKEKGKRKIPPLCRQQTLSPFSSLPLLVSLIASPYSDDREPHLLSSVLSFCCFPTPVRLFPYFHLDDDDGNEDISAHPPTQVRHLR